MKNCTNSKAIALIGACVLSFVSACVPPMGSESSTVRVTYNGNGHTGGAAPIDNAAYSNDSTVTVLGNTGNLTRSGYAFSRWNTAANGGSTNYAPGATFTIGSANVVLYAVWEVGTATVTFDSAGGSSVSPVAATIGSKITLPPNPMRGSYTFAGWWTEENGGGTQFTANTVVSADVTLHAKWVVNAYTITFSANSGHGADYIQAIEYGASENLSSCAFTRTGYSFSGWATSPSGPISFTNGASYTMGSSDVTLYAVWSANTYTITFSANGGSGSGYTQNIVYGQSANLTSCAFTRTGYSFSGWATSSSGPVSYTNGASYTMGSSDVALYAVWSANTYTITFSANGGSGSDYTQDIVYGQSANLTSCAFIRTGYSFSGWATYSSGSVSYTNGASYTMDSSDVTLYAVWSANTYTITFSANGGSGSDYTQDIVYDQSANLTSCAFTRTGYSFSGWATYSSGSVSYTNGASYTMGSSDVTLYAVWSANTYTITFSANGGSGSGYTQDIVYNHSANLTSCAFTRTYYVFSGWATSSNGSVSYADGTSYTMGSGHVGLYAVWTPEYGVSATVSIPGDGTVTFSSSGITVVKGNTLSVSVNQTAYASYEWYVDGSQVSGSTSSVTIATSGLTAGLHSLMIVVTDSAGVSSSGSCRFQVTN